VSLAETRGDSSVDAIPCVPTIDPSTFNSLSRSRGGPSRQHGEESEPETQPLIDRHLDLLNFILTTPAKGLRGAQIKLRVLLNPMAGMAAGRGGRSHERQRHGHSRPAVEGGPGSEGGLDTAGRIGAQPRRYGPDRRRLGVPAAAEDPGLSRPGRHRFSHGQKESRAVYLATERELERLSPRWNALFEFIYMTPAAGMTGVLVKLCMLTDRVRPKGKRSGTSSGS
jgi:hypothetical protein